MGRGGVIALACYAAIAFAFTSRVHLHGCLSRVMSERTGRSAASTVKKDSKMPINDPNPRDKPAKRKPKFGGPTMLLLVAGAIFIAGLFIFFAGYGAVNSAAQ